MLDICYVPTPNGQGYICHYVKAIWEQRDGRGVYADEKCLCYGKMLESVRNHIISFGDCPGTRRLYHKTCQRMLEFKSRRSENGSK